MTYRVTKTFPHSMGLSVAFRQWKAKSHCNKIHGYALKVAITLEEGSYLTEEGWVYDFGNFSWLEDYLREQFDHKLLVARDDPQLPAFLDLRDKYQVAEVVVVDDVGMEAFAKMIYQTAKFSAQHPIKSVEVWEHEGNGVYYSEV